MLKPRALRPGDRIALVSPASPFPRDEFDRGVEELRRLGYEPVWNESVFARDVLTSGSPATRAAAFLEAWCDPSIAALMAVRGGYGSVHLLPLLGADDLRRSPKAFIAYSDNTSLLAWLTTGCGIVGFHGPMLEGRLAKGEAGYDRRSLESAVTTVAGELGPDALEALSDGEAEGALFGGTLTQLLASLGTPFAFNPPDGAVLFLEDVNERPYKLHRMLTQLRLAGLLERARALVFGEMRGCDEPGGEPSAREVISSVLAGFPGPVLFGFPSGHTTGPCWTLPLGVHARVIASGRPRLVIQESAVL
ncbi:MAG: S66 peptidase family protein [Vicinamibacterales bacterium]